MKIRKTIYASIFLIFAFTIYQNILAFRDGIVGLTKKDGNLTGCVCHGFKPDTTVFVKIEGPLNVRQNDTVIYFLKIANGPAQAGGCDISTSLGNIYTSVLDTSLRRAESFPGSGFELTHRYPKLFSGDTLTFTFKYIAPDSFNVVDTIFANANSVNNDTTSENDHWNYAENFLINITPSSGINHNEATVKSFELKQNYPNPFNPETKISFHLNNASDMSLLIYDVRGKEVAKLIDNKFYSSGNYFVTFNAGQYNISSGVYFYKLTAGEFAETKSMVLLK